MPNNFGYWQDRITIEHLTLGMMVDDDDLPEAIASIGLGEVMMEPRNGKLLWS